MTSLVHGPAPRCYALVPCAGTGSRSGADRPKQYVSIAGRTLVSHTLHALSRVPRLTATLVVLAPDDDHFDAAVPGWRGDRHIWTARRGGATRAATVAAGLEELVARGAASDDWVLVHDAARCLVRPEWVVNLIESCEQDEVGGLLALPVADTLKQEEDGRVAATIDRQAKWAAQTPQMFRIGLLRRALAEAGDAVTDEASAIEALGLRPRLVPGALENFKLTWPADFGLAERLLQTMTPASNVSLAPAAAEPNGGVR
ncbi:2-C-methyl-D-erythritol 4-phosphate cytidylyltransferase [uncultured Azohydromonas sp.]|jgi:2-C-methyl-D-erythritol 4-phosphate cytidylyltransferase|uniref:2-C-methyl-D-erythritol 4-phosphate cytidylyltransferase n=1 Tax=uncultured Azohydromonas sp. TaxID=487342 RepID=UPI0026140119|nr:2-C-methyl-D-erythritol 4-phosphate cytidylyltransferase [uncultured Azohydromonas sp.]